MPVLNLRSLLWECLKVKNVRAEFDYIPFPGFIERMSISGINEYYKNLDNYLQTNSGHIQRQLEVERVSGGQDFIFDGSGSFRSLNDSVDGEGYVSDLDEREDTTKRRLVFV